MTHDTPAPSHPSGLPGTARCRVADMRTLREHGVPAAAVNRRCRPGGPWRILLPGVCLLHPGSPTSDELLHAALLYTGRSLIPGQPRPADAADNCSQGAVPVPRQASGGLSRVPERPADAVLEQGPMLTGLAALVLHGFTSAPPVESLDRIDVLVPWTRRLRSAGWARIVRARELPDPEEAMGLPVAPVARALADAVGRLDDAVTVRRLLTESVRGGHCEAQAVVRELGQARLLSRPQVADAMDGLLAEGRAVAEGRLYGMVFSEGLPDPCWNVLLRPPGGPCLGYVDAYWPVEGVALELDTGPWNDGRMRPELVRKREALEQVGISFLYVTPQQLDEPHRQAAIVRTALMTAVERAPSEYVVVTPG